MAFHIQIKRLRKRPLFALLLRLLLCIYSPTFVIVKSAMIIDPDSIYPMFWLFLKVEGLRDEADRAKRECLEVKKIAEEKEVLFKQEQSALRKVGHN